MKKHLVLLGVCSACFSLATNSFAQQAATTQMPSFETSPKAKPAAKTSRMLLSEIEREELALYELFNSINSTDEFDINCSSEAPAMSDSTQQFCEPAFLNKIRQQVLDERAQDTNTDAGLFSRIRNAFAAKGRDIEETVRERAAASFALLQQEMESLAAVNPQLAAQLETIGQLQLAYIESVEADRSAIAYFMSENDPGRSHFFVNSRRSTSHQPWLGAPAEGQSQPTIHYRADIAPRYRR